VDGKENCVSWNQKIIIEMGVKMYEKAEWMEIPEEVGRILGTLGEMESMLEDSKSYLRGEDMIRKTFGNEYYRGRTVGTIPANVIPNGVPDKCRQVLIVAIGSSRFESVEKCILQAIEHIYANCMGITKYVIFWAAKWDVSAWIEHANSFKNVTVILKPFRANPTLLR